MNSKARDVIVVLTGLGVLVGIAVLVGCLFHRPGTPAFVPAFIGASAAVVVLVFYGVCYRWWARRFWGAPFELGDRLRVVKGRHAGKEGRVVALGQGVTVDLELLFDGVSRKVHLPWGSVRRVVAAQLDAAAGGVSRRG
jgi:hypothetical protein